MILRALILTSAMLFASVGADAAISPSNPPVNAASVPTSGKADGGTAKKPKKAKQAKGKKGGGVTFFEGSAENRSERDKRLLRECKGRPNAGACEGYTRP